MKAAAKLNEKKINAQKCIETRVIEVGPDLAKESASFFFLFLEQIIGLVKGLGQEGRPMRARKIYGPRAFLCGIGGKPNT